MDLRRIALAALRAPKRFLDWVYAPDPRLGPTRGEAIVHLRAAALGQDSRRWMAIEAEQRRQHNAAIPRTE